MVTGGDKAGVDFLLIQHFLLFYVSHVPLMLTGNSLSIISIRKGKGFASKQAKINLSRHVHSKQSSNFPTGPMDK